MAELLTHALFAYVLVTLLSVRYPWLTPQYVTVAMMGSLIPDMNRIALAVSADTVEGLLGVPFSWGAFHTPAGSLVAAGVGAMLVPDRYRRRVVALLALGVLSHHALDLLLASPSGYAYEIFWPLSSVVPPSGGYYLSTDRWPAVLSAVVATVVWYVVRYRPDDDSER